MRQTHIIRIAVEFASCQGCHTARIIIELEVGGLFAVLFGLNRGHPNMTSNNRMSAVREGQTLFDFS